ncbi:uncharacterized protein LOC111711319 [Eurytemora carolleeae]|uniref:uncharacterized protein LOC111711319 n=1 Tax=Eurytemora carolleeae TaxID=1294199 RepID=UPI000C75F506|nr:uncharacterized protein LOC111711319 [Eurytemora carolleeae]|eukprot:XP_023341419.1 uncharacterized protein LOC111711319 [Eurytemora affinis]
MPTKLQEVSEIVAQLDEGQLVAEELKGIALMTPAAELKNLEAALDVSGTCVTPARNADLKRKRAKVISKKKPTVVSLECRPSLGQVVSLFSGIPDRMTVDFRHLGWNDLLCIPDLGSFRSNTVYG